MSERVRIKGTEYVYEVADRPLGEDTTEVWRPGMPGGTYQFPNNILERVAPPLPPEPPVGAYVLVTYRTGASRRPDVFRREQVATSLTDESPPDDVWVPLTYEGPSRTWKDLFDLAGKGTVTRLYREDEQPRYEPIKIDGLKLLRWMHPCGDVKGVPPHGEPPRLCNVCENDDQPWFQLYRRSSDDR